MALRAGITFAQFVMMTPFPGTVDFARWEKEQAVHPVFVGDVPLTRYWLIPIEVRPKMFTPHPSMTSEEISRRTQKVWDKFYTWSAIWQRSACAPTLKARIAFHVPLQALPPDVRRNGNLDRQRPQEEVQDMGQVDGEAMPEVVPGEAHARTAVAYQLFSRLKAQPSRGPSERLSCRNSMWNSHAA